MTPTRAPVIVGGGRLLCSVISAVSIAVIRVKIVMPMNIHTIEKSRASTLLGALSPYPKDKVTKHLLSQYDD